MDTNAVFNTLTDIAFKTEAYRIIAKLDRATIARILFDAGYNSTLAARINKASPKQEAYELADDGAVVILDYCKAIIGFIDNITYYPSDAYRYTLCLNGNLHDHTTGSYIYYPKNAIECFLASVELFTQAFKEAYSIQKEVSIETAVTRLSQFANGVEKVIQTANGRAKAAKAMKLYREAIRHRNTAWSIKHNL